MYTCELVKFEDVTYNVVILGLLLDVCQDYRRNHHHLFSRSASTISSCSFSELVMLSLSRFKAGGLSGHETSGISIHKEIKFSFSK